MSPDLFWIPGPWRGRLAIVARPPGAGWLEDEARGWRRARLDVVVSLLEDAETAQLELVNEDQAAESNRIRFISFPIPDRGVPASVPNALALLRDLAEELETGKNIAIHCRQGIGRSGLIAASLLMGSGCGVDRAIEAVGSARGQAIPETAEQLRWIQDLPASRPVAAV